MTLKIATKIKIFKLSIVLLGLINQVFAIDYQARLLNPDGTPKTGSYDVRVSFWSDADAPDGNETDITGSLWTEIQTVDLGGSGKFFIQFGNVTALPSPLDKTVYTHFQIDVRPSGSSVFTILDFDSTDTTIDRKPLNISAFALEANTLQGRDLGYANGEIPFLDANGELPDSVIATTLSGIDTNISANAAAVTNNAIALGNRNYTQQNVVNNGQSITASIDSLDIALDANTNQIAANNTDISNNTGNIASNTNAINALASGITWKAPVATFGDLTTSYGNNPADEGISAYVNADDKIYTLDGTGTWVVTGGGTVPNATTGLAGVVTLAGDGGTNIGVVQGNDGRFNQIDTNSTDITANEVEINLLQNEIGDQQYSNDNFVVDGQSVTASIDALDTALANFSSDTLTDADGDTAVQVERGTDDDVIRFLAGGNDVASFEGTGLTTLSGDLRLGGEIIDSSGATGGTNQLLVSDGAGNNTWENVVLDEDDFVSDSETKGASQQSIRTFIEDKNYTDIATVNSIVNASVTGLIGTAPSDGDTLGELYNLINGITGGVILQPTTWSPSSGGFPAGADKGFWHFADDTGTIDGVTYIAGDSIIALVDGASTTSSSDWYLIKKATPTAVANETAYYQTKNIAQTSLNNTTTPQTVAWNQNPTHNSNATIFQPNANGVQVLKSGDYEVYASLYQESTNSRTNVSVQIAVNGTATGIIGASGYKRVAEGHNEGSSHVTQILSLSAGDIISIQALGLASNGTVVTPADRSILSIKAALSSFSGTTSSAGQTLTITQGSHGFTLPGGVPLAAYMDVSGTVQLAQADDANSLTAFYITEIIDADNFTIQFNGPVLVSGHGLTPGQYYFLSDTVAGSVTTASPSISDVCFYVIDANTIILKDNRPFNL